ncbi:MULTISPECIES: ATP-grasp domain-containing protein [unclassified Mesorhizobium]|uniref:D-alanine--D-alanine ligase family protein n=1 Tax=unclassified Mesorhizobium TaxID=325217 RepID=UPI0009FBE955|nr:MULTISPECIES: ATP-grasp domain-containing protein [unclassified Mesorhizobium]WJI74851.1 ATP-grasp domain-containing protein [Mesorhizobium sp. C395A]
MPLEISFIFGGISTEYDGSITSLTNILSSYLAIHRNKRPFSVKNLYHISRKDGFVRPIPVNSDFNIDDLQFYISENSTISGHPLLVALDDIASREEYVVNLLHGQFGEDGGIQTLAALSGLRGTFGDPHVASLTMNKYAMSSFVSSLLPVETVRSPKTILIRPRNVAEVLDAIKSIQHPIVVKPNSLGSSLFSKLFHDPGTSEVEIEALLRTIFTYDSAALLQEFIPGDEYTCGCLVDSSNIIPLPVVQLEADMQFCGRDQKYSGRLARKTLVELDNVISRKIQSVSENIASSIDVYNMVRFDFRVTDDSQIWFLECNYIPGLAKDGSFEMMLHGHGMTVIDLISFISSKSTPFIKPEHYINYASI